MLCLHFNIINILYQPDNNRRLLFFFKSVESFAVIISVPLSFVLFCFAKARRIYLDMFPPCVHIPHSVSVGLHFLFSFGKKTKIRSARDSYLFDMNFFFGLRTAVEM